MAFGLQQSSATALAGRNYLTSSAVMALLGYKDRGAFWDFVHRGGVPHVRLSARKIMFEEQALAGWLAQRSSNRR
jgi:predicted DNA-binding transcriptional regulator AlpA